MTNPGFLKSHGIASDISMMSRERGSRTLTCDREIADADRLRRSDRNKPKQLPQYDP